MDECFALLQFAASQEATETKTKIYAYDPLRELADRLKERLKACGWDIPEDQAPHGVPSVPATSDAKGSVDVAMDTRIEYSAMLALILMKLSSAIKQLAKNGAESTTLLSIENIASITRALQFYIPTAISPYFDEGVGIAVEVRSKLVKYWKPIRDDDDFRKKRLLSAAQTLASLTECCVQIKQLIIAKFIADFVALNEQLLRLNETSMKQQYEAFIQKEVRRPYLMHQFFFIMSPLDCAQNKSKPPPWLTMALGRRLSEMIMEADGIANLTTALTQDGVTYFENWTFVRSLADVISRRPSFLKEGDSRRTLYHANILKQFIAVMQKHPDAPKIAPWFAASVEAIAALVPRTVAICFTDSLLHPWEVLYHRNKKLMLWTEGWTRRLDDSLSALLYYVRGMSPGSSMQGIERMRKLFPLWLSLYGSALSSTEKVADIERRNMCAVFTDALCCLLARILKDPIFDSDVQRAKFLVAQLAAEDIQMCVEFAFKALVVELNTSDEVGSDKRRLKYEFVRIRALPDDNLELAKARMFENKVIAIAHLLKAFDKSSGEELTLKVLAECILVSRAGNSAGEEMEDEDRFVSIEGHDHTSTHIQMRVQYLMGCLGDLLPEFDLQSEEVFTCIVNVAEVILESANKKLETLQAKPKVDVEVALKGEEAVLVDVQIKSVEMAVALAGAVIINASDSAKVKASLSSLGTVMQRFCVLVKKMDDVKKEKFSIAFENAEKMIDILKCAAVEIPDQRIADSDSSTSARTGMKLREVNVDKLGEIIQGMNDETEAVRGHALIELAKCIRKRDRSVLEAVERCPEIMDLIMKKVADKDSYVYLAAIRAMAELAYWKRNYFEAMVEFFVETNGRLSAILDEMECEELQAAKQDFLLIQRIKVGEALGKVCKTLGDMAPWHFDRLIDPLMSLVMHTSDEQLKASCVSTIADLVVACRGRKISKHLNEMLLMVEQLLSSAKDSLLRRVAVVLLRAIIVSFDTSILQDLSSHLHDLNRRLRHLLIMDRDDGVRLLAELCLLDIKEQMDNAIRDLENSMVKRVRLE